MNIKSLINCLKRSNDSYPQFVFSKKGKIYSFINPYSYHIYRNNSLLYNSFDGLFVDGISMCWWIRFLWGHRIQRLSFDMSSMASDLFKQLNSLENESNIYFIGSHSEEIKNSISQISKAYPNLKIREFRDGYFSNENERDEAIRRIVDLNPTYTIVGMGSPLQEKFALDLKNAGYHGIIFTCGGFLHQTCEDINYYPNWINKYNLRAFYRLFKEKGLWGRMYNVLIQFPILFIWDSLITKLKISEPNRI